MSAQVVRVGIREFREDRAEHLASPVPVPTTRHGRTAGYYIPTQRPADEEDAPALQRAVEQLEALLAERGVSEAEVVGEFRARGYLDQVVNKSFGAPDVLATVRRVLADTRAA